MPKGMGYSHGYDKDYKSNRSGHAYKDAPFKRNPKQKGDKKAGSMHPMKGHDPAKHY